MTISATNGNGVPHTNGVNGTNGYANGHTHENGINDYASGNSHENGISGGLQGSESNGTNGLHMDDANKTAVPIAICGMGLRLPGGNSTPQEFWEFLVNKGDARGRVPTSRYNVSAYHETTKRPTTVATEYGYFLDEDVKLGAMDTTRFSMSRADVEFADPQQRRLLEVVMEAFEDAGEAKFRVCVAFPAFMTYPKWLTGMFRARRLGAISET
jgi:hypothetical protein